MTICSAVVPSARPVHDAMVVMDHKHSTCNDDALHPLAGAANKVFDGITNASVWAMEGLLTMVRHFL